jgi:hypothetical protein
LDRCTIHVEFPVAEFIEPGPGEGVATVRDVRGHRHRKSGSALVSSRTTGKVTIGVGRAVANNALDNLPLRVLGRLRIGSDRKLTRTSTMYGGTHEGDDLGCTGIPLVHLGDGIDAGTLLARKIGRGQWGVIESVLAEGNGVCDNHVCCSTGSKRQKEGGLGKHIGYLLLSLDLLSDGMNVVAGVVRSDAGLRCRERRAMDMV